MNCHAKGIGLPQIKKVEKWEARDGTFHDSLAAAEKYQLHRELQTALKTCEGYCDRQATHLLSHFDIVRKGDPLPGVLRKPATVEYRKAPKTFCTTCYFATGAAVGALLTLALIWFR